MCSFWTCKYLETAQSRQLRTLPLRHPQPGTTMSAVDIRLHNSLDGI